jgi:putative Holliday junction resolvase
MKPLHKPSRIMALDIGEKRIGIAVTDRLNRISYPLKTIENISEVTERISEIIEEYEIGTLVIGNPRSLSGRQGYQSGMVMEFVEKNLKDLNVTVVFFDERYTTVISSDIISEKSVKNGSSFSKGKRIKKDRKKSKIPEKGEKDRIAAALILQGYLQKIENEKI